MKKIAVILIIVTCMVIESYANDTIKLATGEWPPYTSKEDPKGKIVEAIVREAFKTENIDVELHYFPWKRSYQQAQKGAFAGTFPWFKNDERKKDFIFTKESLVKEKEVFFHLKSLDFQWETYEDLKKYKIGVTIGYIAEKLLGEKGIELDPAPSEKLNFKKLLKGRIDAYPTGFIVGYNLIHKMYGPDKTALFTNHPKTIHESDMFLLISRNIPNGQALADKFDKGLKKIKKSGVYDKILDTFAE